MKRPGAKRGESGVERWRGPVRRAAIPGTPGPFVNTPLLRLTPDPKTGRDRFWISTWNSNEGSLAALVDESGRHRIFRFGSSRYPGFYSAVQEDDDTLWLCGWLSEVVRFSLRTGRFDAYPTGAPQALVFQGVVLDRASGKLFAAAFPPPNMKGFVFDTRARKAVGVVDLPFPGHYTRCSFPNGDGTWSVVAHLPGEHLLVWDPKTDRVDGVTLTPERDAEDVKATVYSVIQDARSRAYIPAKGWYNPAVRRIEADGPRPEREMTWFARRGERAFGINYENATGIVGAWDLATGRVSELCRVPDSHLQNVNATASGKIVSVNLYGEFMRFDGRTGALECAVRLPSNARGVTDCLCRIDRDRVLGTPFITQRFWEVNLRTGRGADCGRAAPGVGEVLKVWKAGRKVYMAAYTGAELVEYDPARPPRFPENPRVVADPPGGMRPVARAADGRCLYYACSRHYGLLGSVLTRYDRRTGEARYAADVLGDLQVTSLVYDRRTRTLLAGSTIHSDCRSCEPTSTTCALARLDPESLAVTGRVTPPAGTPSGNVVGPMRPREHLVVYRLASGACRWCALRDSDFDTPREPDLRAFPDGHEGVYYAGRPGWFVMKNAGRLELWDFRGAEPRLARLLHPRSPGIGLVEVQDDSVLFSTPRQVVVLDGCLQGLRSA